MKRKTRALLCVLMIFLLASACLVPASANSAVRYWEGSTAYGVMVGEGQCPIQVLHETLTFDVPHFPDYVSADKSEQYEAKVTADYTLHNPTNDDVTVKLAFPFGQRPNYQFSPIEDEAFMMKSYGVSLNGEPVAIQLRHTFNEARFDLLTDLPRLRDGYLQDNFYSPELAVTHYVYEVSKINVTKTAIAYAELLIESDLGENTKIFVPNSLSPRDGDGVHIRTDLQMNSLIQLIDVYVLGEPLDTMPEWSLHFYQEQTPFDAEFELLDITQMTYYDLAMQEYGENEGITECDWYNAVTDSFLAGEQDFGVTRTYNGTLDMTERLMQWYEYEITVPAGKTVQNSVTAPLFPSINRGYEPSVYEYNYLLSPATTWASFGTLDVIIKTPYYLVLDNEGYESIEGVYQKHYDSLPTGELSLKLSTTENPKETGMNFAGMLFGFLAIIFGSFLAGIVGILVLIFIVVLILFVIVRTIIRRRRR